MKRNLFTLLLLLSVFALKASANTTVKIDSGKIYTAVQTPPAFPGGPDAFTAYITKNIRYPKIAEQNKTKGRVIVSFVVEKDGTLSNFKVVRGISKELNEEALRVLSTSPAWKPGMQNNEAVRVQYTVPVIFSLK